MIRRVFNFSCILILLQLFCFQAIAQAKVSSKTKVQPNVNTGVFLNWDELMALHADQRQAYIQEIREILLMLERRQSSLETKSAAYQEIKEYIASVTQLLALFPEAKAEVGANSDSLVLPFPRTVPGNNRARVCSLPFQYSPELGICVRSNATTEASCNVPEGDQVLKISGGRTYCIPQKALEDRGLSQYRRDIIQQALTSQQAVEGSQVFVNSRARLEAGGPRGTGSVVRSESTQTEQRVRAEVDQNRQQEPAERNREAGNTINQQVAAGRNQASQPQQPTSADLLTQITPQATVLPANAATNGCLTKPTCTPSTVRFTENSRNSDKSCISGGFISSYSSSNRAVGTCRILTTLPSSVNVSAAEAAEQTPANRPRTDAKVCPAGQAMCNPFLFCLNKNSNLGTLCVRRSGGQVTEACETLFKATVGKNGFEACSSENISGLPFKDMWNTEMAKLNDLYSKRCKGTAKDDQEFAGLFCTECNVIYTRLTAMNKLRQSDGANCARTETPAAAATPNPRGIRSPTGPPTGVQ